MLSTPLGTIAVFIDGMPFAYQETACPYLRSKYHVDGCYRIHVPCSKAHSIRCVLDSNSQEIAFSWSSGERYLAAEFEHNGIRLVIGMLNETDGFHSVIVTNGCQYEVTAPTAVLMFGIAWISACLCETDSRAWLAADPAQME